NLESNRHSHAGRGHAAISAKRMVTHVPAEHSSSRFTRYLRCGGNLPTTIPASRNTASTWRAATSPYNLQSYVHEVDGNHVEDYVVLSHLGCGANSYAIQ